MPIVSVADFASDGGGEGGVKGESLPPYGPGGIYHEKQIGALCALHAMNNLLQGRVFDEYQLAEVAHGLDRKEAAIMGGARLDKEGYSNVRADGFFNVQVIRAGLLEKGFDMERVAGERAQELLKAPEKQRGFILNKKEHWFSLRRIGQEWFDLNSCLRTPRHFFDRELASTVNEAVAEGYTVFVVAGPYAKSPLEDDSKKLLEAVKGCGHFRQTHVLFAGGGHTLGGAGSSSTPTTPATPDPALSAQAEQDPALAAAIAASLSGSSAPSSSPATPAVDPALQQSDPELYAAMVASLQQSAPTPAAAPAPANDAAAMRAARLARFG